VTANIHPTAIISNGAELGDGVKIGAYSIIGENVKLGSGVVVGPHAVIDGHTEIGAGSYVFQFASIGAPPQDLKYKGEPTKLVLGQNNIIRECVTISPGTITGNKITVIGSNNLLMAYSHVAHDCVVGDGNIFANGVALAGHVTIGNKTTIGGMAGIHQFACVGDYAFIGAGSMVSKDIPPYAIAQGDRARIRGVNIIGLRRAGFKREEIRAIKSSFIELFVKVGVMDNKIKNLPTAIANDSKVQLLISFIQSSKRGIAQSPGAVVEADDD
jgi:UDP-N-acetylglucosamine acyltransferase